MRHWLTALALIGVAPLAAAWGPEGHRIVAQIAAEHLTPEAKAVIDVLLAGEGEPTLPGISNWADEARTPETAPLHYVDLPRGDCRYQPKRDCPDGQCVVVAIEESLATLKNPATTPEARLTALKDLVHFVGDLHQPLHAGLHEDRGGNTLQIQWRGQGDNLHRLWDSGLIARTEPDWRRYAQRLAPLAINADLGTLDPADWAQASCSIVQDPAFYPANRQPGEAYRIQWLPTLDKQLSLAGLRLAALLNNLPRDLPRELP